MCTKSKKVPAFFWSVLRYYIPSFKKKNEKLHKRATVYSCFLHMCFLWVIFISNLHPFPNVVVHNALYKIKKTASNAAFLGEGIFTMGYSKRSEEHTSELEWLEFWRVLFRSKSKKVPAFFWSVLRYYIPSFEKKYEKLHKRATVYSHFLHIYFFIISFTCIKEKSHKRIVYRTFPFYLEIYN